MPPPDCSGYRRSGFCTIPTLFSPCTRGKLPSAPHPYCSCDSIHNLALSSKRPHFDPVLLPHVRRALRRLVGRIIGQWGPPAFGQVMLSITQYCDLTHNLAAVGTIKWPKVRPVRHEPGRPVAPLRHRWKHKVAESPEQPHKVAESRNLQGNEPTVLAFIIRPFHRPLQGPAGASPVRGSRPSSASGSCGCC